MPAFTKSVVPAVAKGVSTAGPAVAKGVCAVAQAGDWRAMEDRIAELERQLKASEEARRAADRQVKVLDRRTVQLEQQLGKEMRKVAESRR